MIKIVDADVHLVITSDRDAMIVVGGASVQLTKLELHKVAMIAHLAKSAADLKRKKRRTRP